MIKLRIFAALPFIAALAFLPLAACGSDDDDDGGGGSSGNGSSGSGGGGSCATECPNGSSDCPNIVCDCPDGPVNARLCHNGCCADKATTCEGACE
ncbi:MAG: hypothetical protein ACOC1F_05285 [Myxococcota bacterium]